MRVKNDSNTLKRGRENMLIFMKLCCLFIMEVFAAVIFLEGILQWKQKEPVCFWS